MEIEGKVHTDDQYLITFSEDVVSKISWEVLVVKQLEKLSFNLCEMEIHAFRGNSHEL